MKVNHALGVVFLPVFMGLSGCFPSDMSVKASQLNSIDQRLVKLDQTLAQRDQKQLKLVSEYKTSVDKQQAVLKKIEADVSDLKKQVQADAKSRSAQAKRSRPMDTQQVKNQSGYLYVGDKLLIGEIEDVHLSPVDLELEARIDTGAKTSSLDAQNLKVFERDGEEWVAFNFVDRKTKEVHEIERPVSRFVLILQSNSEEKERRPVVKFKLTIGNVPQMVEFTLSDRSHLDFSVLIGRNVLKDLMLVDISKKKIAPPEMSSLEKEVLK
ncbi:RimK/LysX family protein [Hydrogenovibrio sp. 3SP14C1]|uniref:ATP-dependent zinc protease family protein n=1 Tax=Hydrogenovibrio sp. 3SP14C1 TaxID=3038774 RepID=UPI002417D9EC|nr:RimK/LysX family protein [Hydrogenovibrio sp. 3SP14C1]MDG4813404.1 RimK/LysX family protein [Hydrogenovibrio sp. 3SP14C1]